MTRVGFNLQPYDLESYALPLRQRATITGDGSVHAPDHIQWIFAAYQHTSHHPLRRTLCIVGIGAPSVPAKISTVSGVWTLHSPSERPPTPPSRGVRCDRCPPQGWAKATPLFALEPRARLLFSLARVGCSPQGMSHLKKRFLAEDDEDSMPKKRGKTVMDDDDDVSVLR